MPALPPPFQPLLAMYRSTFTVPTAYFVHDQVRLEEYSLVKGFRGLSGLPARMLVKQKASMP